MRRQRITIKTERMFIIYPSTLRGENRAQKTHNNPHVEGARTQDKQHDAGHPNSPTIQQVHASSSLVLGDDHSLMGGSDDMKSDMNIVEIG